MSKFVSEPPPTNHQLTWFDRESPVRDYVLVIGILAATTILGLLVRPLTGTYEIGFLYLFSVVFLSARYRRGPVLVSAMLSAFLWDYLFIPPMGELRIDTLSDGLMLATYFVVALTVGHLTTRLRSQQALEHERQRQSHALYRLSRALEGADDAEDALRRGAQAVDDLFGLRIAYLLRDPQDPSRLKAHPSGNYGPASSTIEAIARAPRFDLPSHELMATLDDCFVLRGGDEPLGAILVHHMIGLPLTAFSKATLIQFADQVAFLVQRDQLRTVEERTRRLSESERLHRTLLDTVSHELKTPLAVIATAVQSFGRSPETVLGQRDADLLDDIRIAARRLGRHVENLLDASRLDAGALLLQLDWVEVSDLMNTAVESVKDWLKAHPLTIDLGINLPLVRLDFSLMEEAVVNLLVNAAVHTPPGTPILIRTRMASEEPPRVSIEVVDRGPGLPSGGSNRLFGRFQSGDQRPSGGLGLGLSIVRRLAEAHGGTLQASDNPGGGALFAIVLPVAAYDPLPSEAV